MVACLTFFIDAINLILGLISGRVFGDAVFTYVLALLVALLQTSRHFFILFLLQFTPSLLRYSILVWLAERIYKRTPRLLRLQDYLGFFSCIQLSDFVVRSTLTTSLLALGWHPIHSLGALPSLKSHGVFNGPTPVLVIILQHLEHGPAGLMVVHLVAYS